MTSSFLPQLILNFVLGWTGAQLDLFCSPYSNFFQVQGKTKHEIFCPSALYFTYLGPSASQSSDGDASAASRILVVSFLQVCLFWATDLKCSRSFRLVSCSLLSDTRVRSLLRTTGSVVKGRPLNLLPCDIK